MAKKRKNDRNHKAGLMKHWKCNKHLCGRKVHSSVDIKNAKCPRCGSPMAQVTYG